MRPDVAQLPEASLVGDLVLRPEQRQQLEHLVQSRGTLLVRDAERLELLGAVAEADAEDVPALGHHVEGGDLLREQHRVVERSDHDVRDESHVRLDVGSQSRQQGDRLQPAQVAVQEVLAEAEVGAAGLLRGLDEPADVGELRGCG